MNHLIVLLFTGVMSEMPLPFTRDLYLTTPSMSGNDVTIAQNLLIRDGAVTQFSPNGVFGEESNLATTQFQQANNLTPSGVFDEETASLLLKLHSADGEPSLHLL
jgi:peptidoglycan hydrolase-like protein with peptidoglycan-binding domain